MSDVLTSVLWSTCRMQNALQNGSVAGTLLCPNFLETFSRRFGKNLPIFEFYASLRQFFFKIDSKQTTLTNERAKYDQKNQCELVSKSIVHTLPELNHTHAPSQNASFISILPRVDKSASSQHGIMSTVNFKSVKCNPIEFGCSWMWQSLQ